MREAFSDKSLVTADLQGFHRRFQFQALANVTAVLKMAQAAYIFRRAMRRERPDVAVGFGSYASAPGVLAAASLRVPVLIHEQNAIPGLTNRLLGRLARGWRWPSPSRAGSSGGGRSRWWATRCGRSCSARPTAGKR